MARDKIHREGGGDLNRLQGILLRCNLGLSCEGLRLVGQLSCDFDLRERKGLLKLASFEAVRPLTLDLYATRVRRSCSKLIWLKDPWIAPSKVFDHGRALSKIISEYDHTPSAVNNKLEIDSSNTGRH